MDKIFASIIILPMLATFNYYKATFDYLKLFLVILAYFTLGYFHLL
jgi:hypothetical protein